MICSGLPQLRSRVVMREECTEMSCVLNPGIEKSKCTIEVWQESHRRTCGKALRMPVPLQGTVSPRPTLSRRRDGRWR